jgi:dTDP-4-dehydrorhamnose reductase
MLGFDLVPVLKTRGYRVLATDLVKLSGVRCLDVRDYSAVKTTICRFKPSYVLHLAAETDVELCESNPDRAYLTNVIGTENVAITCADRDIPLVYIGTSGVFDGRKVNRRGAPEPYTEFDDPHPINVYGMSKYQAEKTVRQTCDRYLIVRAGWMMGGLERDKKFVGKILNQLSRNPKKIYAVKDRVGSPTYTLDFAKAIVFLIESDFRGLYHAACTGTGSRYDVAKQILQSLRRADVKLLSVSNNFFKNTYPAPRAVSQSLRNYKLELRGIHLMPTWQAALRSYLARWKGS